MTREEARQFNQEAAKSMKYGGMSANDALKMITINPAIQLGIDKRVGSIEVGKDADLVIYNHDPLSVYAVAQKTLIDGQVYFDRAERYRRPPRPRQRKTGSARQRERKPPKKRKDEDKKGGDKDGVKPDAKKKPDPKKKPPQERDR